MRTLLSRLQIKLPILHYRLEGPELLQGVLMIAVGLSTVPVLQETLGMSYSAALTAVAIAEALGLLHVTFGDPVVPGWIASALPLVLVYMADYAVGIQSAHALIALQLIVGLLFVLLGATGLAHRLMTWIPGSLKAGILFGAAVEALGRIFGEGGYLAQYPLSVGAGALVTMVVLFSNRFRIFKERSRLAAGLAKYGMLPGLVAAMAVGFLSGELPLPQLKWGLIPFDYGEVFRNFSVFSIGLPSVQSFAAALPTAVAIYIIAFGEIVTAEAVLDEAKEDFEKVKELTIRLSMIENAAYRLAVSIKKTQKRANALKNITIPTYEALAKNISNALEEKEREEFTRLKVIKRTKEKKEGKRGA